MGPHVAAEVSAPGTELSQDGRLHAGDVDDGGRRVVLESTVHHGRRDIGRGGDHHEFRLLAVKARQRQARADVDGDGLVGGRRVGEEDCHSAAPQPQANAGAEEPGPHDHHRTVEVAAAVGAKGGHA